MENREYIRGISRHFRSANGFNEERYEYNKHVLLLDAYDRAAEYLYQETGFTLYSYRPNGLRETIDNVFIKIDPHKSSRIRYKENDYGIVAYGYCLVDGVFTNRLRLTDLGLPQNAVTVDFGFDAIYNGILAKTENIWELKINGK